MQNALKKGVPHVEQKHPCVAVTYRYLGLYYYYDNVPDQALSFLNKALALMKSQSPERLSTLAELYDNLGDVYYHLRFDHAEAEKYYTQALRIREAKDGKKNQALIYSYYNLANLNLSIGDYDQAQSFCYQAIDNAAYVTANKVYWLELLEGALANIFIEQKLFQQAIGKLHRAIRLNDQNKGEYMEIYYNRKRRHSALGYKSPLAYENDQLLILTTGLALPAVDCFPSGIFSNPRWKAIKK